VAGEKDTAGTSCETLVKNSRLICEDGIDGSFMRLRNSWCCRADHSNCRLESFLTIYLVYSLVSQNKKHKATDRQWGGGGREGDWNGIQVVCQETTDEQSRSKEEKENRGSNVEGELSQDQYRNLKKKRPDTRGNRGLGHWVTQISMTIEKHVRTGRNQYEG
jgi:hypothetical protein